MPRLVKYKNEVSSRSDLLTLLSEACELEHGLACSYMYTAFSLKQEVSEGVSEKQIHYVKKWASQIFFIASQEMLHLAQVWNLLSAIGGTPYYFRPNFPQESKYYPFNLPLKLEPFGLSSLKRFILYEYPSHLSEKEYINYNFGFTSEDDYSYKTIGELYKIIYEGIDKLDENTLFIGDKNLQIDKGLIDFQDIITVTNKHSAKAAIDLITEQGEGTNVDHKDCHYGMFLNIEEELKKLLDGDLNFQPSRDTLINPRVFDRGNFSAGDSELIINIDTREVADIFDDIYNLMLRSLQLLFQVGYIDSDFSKQLASFSINLMVRIIKPLGELLSLLPAYNDPYYTKAGPVFSLTKHIPLSINKKISKIVIRERFESLIVRTECIRKKISNDKFESIIKSMKQLLHAIE